MKFSEQWLREWVNPDVSTEVLAEQLTMAGLEVDAIEAVAPEFSGVVVGEVLKVEPHPDADKLRVCQVNVGADEALNIVCGAANVREGMRVPTAVVGARLPGDFKIKKSKLRGVQSLGMLCSEKELGLAESAEGLMELPANSPVGQDVRDYLELNDVTIELGLTPNRGDCLSIAGVAREVGVLNRCVVEPPAMDEVPAQHQDGFPVSLAATEDCPRYVGRVIKGIDNAAETPMWMQERLRRSGIRSLGPVVDVTNYVLLELGQPMHAFDLAKLKDGISVRRAEQGETLALLNDTEVTLDPEVLVIADGNGAQAMAGVMGGSPTAVGEQTCDIFLESASFNPDTIAGRARRFGLHTDSSHRFERGVDPQLQRRAVERATALLLSIVGGAAGPVIDVMADESMAQRQPVALRASRIEQVLGLTVDRSRVTEILERLDMVVTTTEEGWSVTPPSFRFDIEIEEDLIEEVGRIIGYDELPSAPPRAALNIQPKPEAQLPKQRLRQALISCGYQEAVTYSFVDPKLQQVLSPREQGIALSNPISSDLSVMRTTLWPGLVQALSYNVNRQQERVRLFELGLSFNKQDDEIVQKSMIAGVAYGDLMPEQWGEPARRIDFYDVKADLEKLLALSGSVDTLEFAVEAHPVLHPGRSARIYRDGTPLGWLGALHPAVEKQLSLPGGIYLFELDLETVLQGNVPKFTEISKYPAIRRDLAIVVAETVTASQVAKSVHAAAPESLVDLKLFDVYAGEHIDSGRKSLALGLTLQAQSRTLTDEEVDAAIEAVVSRLNADLDATLRE